MRYENLCQINSWTKYMIGFNSKSPTPIAEETFISPVIK
jgi:hypothetical protein